MDIRTKCLLCDTEIPVKVMSLDGLLSHEPDTDQVAILLKEALQIVLFGGDGRERACWRVADALYLLADEFPRAAGIDEPTGRGAMLVKIAKSD